MFLKMLSKSIKLIFLQFKLLKSTLKLIYGIEISIESTSMGN